MPLSPSQKAAMALRLVAARCLDPRCDHDESDRAADLRAGACSALRSHAHDAKINITEDAEISAFIRGGITKLDHYVKGREDLAESQAILGRYEHALSGGNGEGSAWGQGINVEHCRAGLLELAHLIEAMVRTRIRSAGVELKGHPEITYTSSVAANPNTLGPFKVHGDTDITLTPRVVDMVIADGDLDGEDIIDIAYVIVHELVCHAFQTCLPGGGPTNAHERCSWSEGWMDVIAHDIAAQWVADGPRDWLPLRGDDALGSLRTYHEYRYSGKNGLLRSDFARRRNSRHAFRRLLDLFSELGLARSHDDARTLTDMFSWRLQTHSAVKPGALADLASRISRVLGSPLRRDDHVKVAFHCMRFAADSDLDQLRVGIPSA